MLLSKDAISFIKDDLVSKKQKYTEKWMPVNDDLNFYWISDPGKKDSRILKNNVLYSYSAWQNLIMKLLLYLLAPFHNLAIIELFEYYFPGFLLCSFFRHV